MPFQVRGISYKIPFMQAAVKLLNEYYRAPTSPITGAVKVEYNLQCGRL